MPVKQGSVELLQHPASKELLQSAIPARLAYVWTDGTPRVVPIWFHWNEREFYTNQAAQVSGTCAAIWLR
jgi:nitroimidazol reductase NimA-like FMN-containing flavoprotein (pyridoxamine 5'-phosphate oxidase superfamily)